MILLQRGPIPSRGAPSPLDMRSHFVPPPPPWTLPAPAGPGILLVDLAYRPGSLSADEFVAPVERIVREEGFPAAVRHYTEIPGEDLASAGGVILCGTALADCGYLGRIELFSWLPPFPRPVLGICAGMQVVTKLFGGETKSQVSIGMTAQEVVASDPLFTGRDRFDAYELHSLSVVPPHSFRVLATSPSGYQVIRHPDRPVYGVMFHPEVRNEWLIRGFLALCRPAGRRTDALMEERG
jgi:GMP synthase-like glutamine amidotransferase